MKILLEVMPVLLGFTVGWGLSRLSSWLDDRRAHRRAHRRVLQEHTKLLVLLEQLVKRYTSALKDHPGEP